MDVREYSASDVVMTFGGAVVEGWNRIIVRRNQPTYRIEEGIRNKNTRVRVGNTSAIVEIVLAQTSPTNNIFSKIVSLDEVYGTARIEVMIKDTLTGEFFASNEAFLERPSDLEFSADLSDRVWRMVCLSSEFKAGTGGALGALIDKVTSFF